MSRPDIAPSGEPVRSDEEIAREINTEHGHVETYKRNTIQHAIRCGELLLEMKQRTGHGNWLAWVEQHFEASERTARNYMEIAKSAAAADFDEDTTMRSALKALASRPRAKETEPGNGNGQTSKTPTDGHAASQDDTRAAETVAAPRAGLDKIHRHTWASVPTRLNTIKQVLDEAAGDHLDDHKASEALHKASREAHQTATDLEQLANVLERHA